MSVRNGFMIKIYGFMHSLRTFWHMLLMMPSRTMAHDMEIKVDDPEDIEDDARTSPDVWKMVNCSTKDQRQDSGDKKRLARHQPSDLLCLLTHAWIGGGQHSVVSHRALPF